MKFGKERETMPDFSYRYSVMVIRSGQPRPYANTEREYKIYCERYQNWGLAPDKDKWHPWVPGIFGGIECDSNGVPTDLHERAKIDMLAKALTQRYFRDRDDPQANWASPFLQWMKIDVKAGTIHFFITEEYTD